MLKTGGLLIGLTDGKSLADAVMSYLRRNGIVSIGVEGRNLQVD